MVAVEPWVARSIVFGRMLYYVLLQNRMCQEMALGHEIITSTSCVSKGLGWDFGTILQN